MIRLGITTIPPRSTINLTNLSLSYHLSARISLPVKSKGSSNACVIQISLRLPPESRKRRGLPNPSVSMWTFVVNPPRLRPVSSLYPPFFSPAAMLMCFYCYTVQHQRSPVHQSLCNQGIQYLSPYICTCP